MMQAAKKMENTFALIWRIFIDIHRITVCQRYEKSGSEEEFVGLEIM